MTDLLPGVPGDVVLTQQADGYAVIPVPTPLTRLNFFDGRVLRGDDLTVEQNAQRSLSFALGRAGGPGVAHGLDVELSGERLTLSPGLAVDPEGRLLLLPSPVTATVDDVLDATRGATSGAEPASSGAASFAPCETLSPAPVAEVAAGSTLYLLTASRGEGLCGHAEVYGAPCEQACGTTTGRPYRIDGVLLRLRPLRLDSPLPGSASVLLDDRHLRSRVAAAYFADERTAAGPRMSAALLASGTWCRGAPGATGSEVPLAVLARSGGTTLFADAWTVRRELLDTPARGFGDSRMSMRARNVFAAQIAQFQCQLAGLLGAGLPKSPADRLLVDAGVVELPPAGYLPVDPAGDLIQQVGSLLGPGVDLRFVRVPADHVPHEVEEVQHRNRISLLAGIDDPSARPELDVLVPDGRDSGAPIGIGRGARVHAHWLAREGELEFRGVGRWAARTSGFALTAAGFCAVSTESDGVEFVSSMASGRPDLPSRTDKKLWISTLRRIADEAGRFAAEAAGQHRLYAAAEFAAQEAKPIVVRGRLSCDRDLWELPRGESAFVAGQLDLFAPYRIGPDDEPSNGPAAAMFEILGRVEAYRGTSDSGTTTRRFRVRFQLSVDQGDGRGPTPMSVTDLDAAVALVEQPGERLFTIRPNVGIIGTHASKAARDGVMLRLKDDGTVILSLPDDRLRATLTADRDALGPNSPHRVLGEQSLGVLRGAHTADGEFYDGARADLFGSARDEYGAAVIIATHDWVAFRRRRVDRPSSAQPPTRSVVVWVAAANDPRTAASWAARLRRGSADELPWQRVRSVLFELDTAKLRSDPEELRRGYAATQAPPLVHAVGLGGLGPLPAGRDRALAIAAALRPTADLDPRADVFHVPALPAGLLEPDSDGSVLLIACHPAPTKAGLIQVVGLDGDYDSAALEAALQHRDLRLVDEKAEVLGTLVTQADGHLDQQSYDTALAATNRAVTSRGVLRSTPVLWIDPEWEESAPEAARLITPAAKKFVSDVRGHYGPQLALGDDRVIGVAVASQTRQALLIVHHRAELG
ncbi:hypothetical protein [Streptomyces coerulescens]|uniref:Uncharacterized protein n=1 Tax=Streptomyces coerulescens TaxID=29304 RepID=A0ABW0CX22_STRCD